MDANGTTFHLLREPEDWAGCLVETPDGLRPLRDVWESSTAERLELSLEWDPGADALTLARKVPLFRQSRRGTPLELDARRGAGRDRYGHWYWIDPAERAILRLARGERAPTAWFTPGQAVAACPPALDAAFRACRPTPPPVRALRGLAVTRGHYLAVGSPADHGVLVFDLHGGGPPLLVRWPAATPFSPWDIAATPDGGLLILDRDNLTYWALDADFRLLADLAPGAPADFQPADPDAPRRPLPGAVYPQGFPLDAVSPPGPLSPVSIEPGPDGHVLILDSDPERPYSIVYEYRGAEQLGEFRLLDAVEMVDPREGDPQLASVVAHDFVFVPGCPLEPPPAAPCQATGVRAAGERDGRSNGILYLAERDGNQVFAFELIRAPSGGLELEDKREFLPLRRWGGKALVGVGNDLFYDFASRWVPLRVFAECVYAGRALLVTPADFSAAVPGQPFDSGQAGCVWHRLLLDAAIPQGGRVRVRARAADDPELLPAAAWLAQPDPYLRDGEPELPYFEPWPERRDDDSPLAERTGTWELLFQGVRGRYLQLELELLGTGRSSLALRALRAWYPRFSYPDQYLPAIYREEPGPASFLERWLANFEGFYTTLEGKIAGAPILFDPRTAPPESLEWLGCWLGLALDPLLGEAQRRFLIRHADQLYRQRGTLPGVETAVRLYLEDPPDQRLFDPACLGRGKVRVVEHFRTRGIGGLAFGDPTDAGARPLRPLTVEDAALSAHRFSVLVAHDLSPEQFAMVGRIVELEKPAHTQFALKRFWDLFRAGEARLGLDTRLGASGRFGAMELGASYLTESYLDPSYPFDIADRLVSDRDRLGELPPL